MMNVSKGLARIAACAAVGMFGASAAHADLDTVHLEIIVGNHTDPFTKEWQLPYFGKYLTERSGGKITVNVVLNRAGFAGGLRY